MDSLFQTWFWQKHTPYDTEQVKTNTTPKLPKGYDPIFEDSDSSHIHPMSRTHNDHEMCTAFNLSGQQINVVLHVIWRHTEVIWWGGMILPKKLHV